ncbi:hypothetical protein DQ400_15850 [Vreelandella sulfidaeris]|uniref:Uncharacterized protein n=1 Tax=Vreelandella sulfidaeris TaxID=115553 RepID=A0A365TJP4_9GAMM|nr:hypothetical protein [Halomonas sulfidaeris]RBI65936.1 hypothetical protein DQ400_15850 [Halomonas sulfidaeris]
MLTSLTKKVSGTAGEALEIAAYKRLHDRYDNEEVVAAIIESELRSAGETNESFGIYLRVKTKVQNDEISIVRAAKEAESLTKDYLCATGFTEE